MTDSRHNLYFIITVLNEAENLPDLFIAFDDLLRQFSQDFSIRFIIVNDGSTDDTDQIITRLTAEKNLPVVLLSHEQNMGPGIAFGTAFESLVDTLKDNDWVVTMEGDNTSRHELLQQMFVRTKEGYDVILASPYMYTGGIVHTTTYRVILSNIANVVVKEFFGINGILTVSSFYRLYRGSIIKTLQQHYGTRIIQHAGFECMLELLIKMIRHHTTISEVPMVLDTSRRKGKSKMKILRTIIGYFHLLADARHRGWILTSRGQDAQ